jgi:alkylated DNA repair dioxygenase AlkB
MSLFSENLSDNNVLPYDGDVRYYGSIFSPKESHEIYSYLMENIAWKNDVAVMFGKTIVTARKVAWYADAPFEYEYSNTKKVALIWNNVLLKLKDKVESISNETYNACLLNLYHTGKEGMAWHSDAERDLKKHGAIASLSFGAERKFAFKHKRSKETRSLVLEQGSLMVMKGNTQDHWLHRLPPTTKVSNPRINLTFRTIVENVS